MNGIFSSESVTEGHPDKIADFIADRVLDECLKNDPYSRVAAEVNVMKGKVILFGEITTADAGFTERKLIVDTYGGYSRHEGGAFSGKDPSKTDRSGSVVVPKTDDIIDMLF